MSVPADFTALVLEERNLQLFGEGHRCVDMLRKNLPFPSGVDHKGRTISNLACVPLPNVETQSSPELRVLTSARDQGVRVVEGIPLRRNGMPSTTLTP